MGVATWNWDPGEIELPYLELVTLPARASWRCLATCERLYTPHTHWISGRTLPCIGDDCGACGAELPRRPEGFCSCVTSHDRQHKIVRLTRDATISILRSAGPDRNVRGLIFTLARRGSRDNGHVHAVVDEADCEGRRMPTAPDLLLHLSRVWRIDGWEPQGRLVEYAAQLKLLIDRSAGGDPDAKIA
jgi:hypothetical protein